MSKGYDMIFGIFFGIFSAYIFTFDIYVVPYTRAGWSVKTENTDGPGRCREGPAWVTNRRFTFQLSMNKTILSIF